MPEITKRQLSEHPSSEVGALASFLPDTPWTTRPVQACERHTARVWLDSHSSPRNLAVQVRGELDGAPNETLYLFGSDVPCDVLVALVSATPRPVDVVCDPGVGRPVLDAHPDATVEDHSVHWFENLDTVARPELPGLRRLRLTDADALERLGVPGLLCSFESCKDLLMAGGASALVENGEIVAAAVTVDLSVNYARIVAFTRPDRRRQGLATAVCRHLVSAHHEQGRLACAVVPPDAPAAEVLVRSVGFESAARLKVLRLS